MSIFNQDYELICGSLLRNLFLECREDLGRDEHRIDCMNSLSRLNSGCGSQVLALHQGQHDLKTPNDRNALSFAGIAQRTIVGQASPTIVPGKHQTKLVLKRQRTTALCSLGQLSQITLHDLQSKGQALRLVQLLNLLQNISRHINWAHMLSHQPQNGR